MIPHSCQASTHQRGCPPAILPVKTREQQKHYDTDLRRNNRGRKAVQVVESAGKPYYYSTVGNEQAIEAVHAIRLTGGMDEEKMAQFCREKKSRC